jgi:pimeloyl-ACP methyl ester carboxylesterase
MFVPPAQQPMLQRSRAFECQGRSEYWLRFDSPSQRMNDTLTVRVSEPLGVVDPPTVIYLHGIAVETEHWRTAIDPADELCALGLRVVRPEAPWHGRRVAPGCYGGEKFVGTVPRGTLDFFSAHVRELGVLTRWARSLSDAPVGWAGSSLGAHVIRLAAIKAAGWSATLRPDAMLLLEPCGDLEAAANHGAMGRLFDSRERSRVAGWSGELMHRWYAAIDPQDLPAISGERIVAVMGTHDTVTPYPAAAALIERLGVPVENRFAWRLGHFGLPLRLLRDPAPLHRLAVLLGVSL